MNIERLVKHLRDVRVIGKEKYFDEDYRFEIEHSKYNVIDLEQEEKVEKEEQAKKKVKRTRRSQNTQNISMATIPDQTNQTVDQIIQEEIEFQGRPTEINLIKKKESQKRFLI